MEKQVINGTKLILVTGGARSGKSSFAEEYAKAISPGNKVAYIATAQIYDEEMRFRVKKHRARRPESWQTYEAPDEEQVMSALQEAGESHDVILFDCLTLFMSNFLCALSEEELEDEAGLYERTQAMLDRFIDTVAKLEKTRAVIVVTNEVGAGIVPQNHLARLYRDLSGRANQMLAEAAQSVYLVTCGQAINLKKLAVTAKAAVADDMT